MHSRMDFIPSRLPKAHRAVSFQPSRHASPRVSTAMERKENTGTATLAPGMYVIKDGPLNISSQAFVNGQGVTFFLTGNNAGFGINGGGAVNLAAPTAGQFVGILIMQDRNANPGGSNTLSGGSETALRGAIYTPTQGLTVTG